MPDVYRHRHGKRYTQKRMAVGKVLLSASSPAPHRTWETFSITIRDADTGDSYEVVIGRADAERIVTFLREHLDAVLPPAHHNMPPTKLGAALLESQRLLNEKDTPE